MIASSSFRPPGSLPAAPLASYSGPWNKRVAAHLLRRAGFGGSPADVARAAAGSMNAAVDALIHFPATDLPAQPGNLPDPYGAMGEGMRAAMQSAADPQAFRQERMQARRQANIAMSTWWLDRMLKTPAPLQEKMTLFWHGHFATAAGTKGISPQEAVAQNNLFRAYALGDIRALAQAVSRDPAMLKYLDNARSEKAHPNENYARELMELFTLGIGNYSERDVRESARAFTGWSIRRRLGGFYENAAQHDDGPKTFLGQTGNFNGDDIVRILFEQPAAPKWFARKLLAFFVYSDPEPELVDALAGSIVRNGFHLEPVMSMLLRSNVFYSGRAYRALVKSPVEFVIGSYTLYGMNEILPQTLLALNRMGQTVFHPPSVKGWDGGAAWLNSQTVLTRENFAGALMASPQMMQGQSWLTAELPAGAQQAAAKLVDTVLYGDASAASTAQLEAYLDGTGTSALGTLSGENFQERMRGAAYLTMAMPAYQLS